MTDTNPRAVLGGNMPPDPLDAAVALYETDREEAETWLDGKSVENTDQMKAVDALTASMKEARKAVDDAKESEYRPHKTQCDNIVAKYKPTLEDHDTIIKGLVSIVSMFKTAEAARVKAATDAAWAEANRLRIAAEEAKSAENVGDLESARGSTEAAKAVIEAEKAAKAVAKSAPKGMRTVTKHEVIDLRALVNFIAKTDKDAMAAFATEYARKHHADIPNEIVNTYTVKEAY